jgi:hypothetical protein
MLKWNKNCFKFKIVADAFKGAWLAGEDIYDLTCDS